mmetsp:Transcript_22932/g.62215  ORF Transcript_22932/g.62215 Transcript_22932/m.62215 type:complete len:227 (+) Transcript_22932:2022-2702(+)
MHRRDCLVRVPSSATTICTRTIAHGLGAARRRPSLAPGGQRPRHCARKAGSALQRCVAALAHARGHAVARVADEGYAASERGQGGRPAEPHPARPPADHHRPRTGHGCCEIRELIRKQRVDSRTAGGLGGLSSICVPAAVPGVPAGIVAGLEPGPALRRRVEDDQRRVPARRMRPRGRCARATCVHSARSGASVALGASVIGKGARDAVAVALRVRGQEEVYGVRR